MHLTPLQWYLAAMYTLAELILVIRMLRNGSWRRWTSLFAFLVLMTAKDVLRIGNTFTFRSSFFDFYCFWCSSLLGDFIEIWMIIQIGLALGGLSKWLRWAISRVLPAVAIACLAISVGYAFHDPMPAYARLTYVVWHLDPAISIAWLNTFLVVALIAEAVGIKWTPAIRGLAIGFTLELTSSTYLGWLRLRHVNTDFVDNSKSVIYLAALVVWGFSLKPWRKPEREDVPERAKYPEIIHRPLQNSGAH